MNGLDGRAMEGSKMKTRFFFQLALTLSLGINAMAIPGTLDGVAEAVMRPYAGPSVRGVDTSTLTGKVMCGYQGWFTCEGDGAERGWFHWGNRGGFKPGSCSIDFWPDVSELDRDELYATPFRHGDGRTAYVFSSMNRKTVLRHFQWSKTYGIDGMFVQRFAVETLHPSGLNHKTTVLAHCREGANRYGRAYAVMYDLSGLREGQMAGVMADWRRLVDRMKLTRDPADRAYLHHKGKPVVAVWGIGFNDHRQYTLDECGALIDFLKYDPEYGGCTVMIGVPSYWRNSDGKRDAVADPKLIEVMLKADIISPWSVGRYGNPKGALRYAKNVWEGDIAWCRDHGKDYLPVVFPGFSWHNLRGNAPLDQIPRLKGTFLWSQYAAAVESGATMVYQAMFDEVDEGTAIFKCTNDPPVGKSSFVTYEGLPSDYYLWLVGQAAAFLRNGKPIPKEMPAYPAK